jgi:Zn-dependent peptidase ImmA (M78 family)
LIISENERYYEIRQKASNLLKELDIDTSTAIDIREIIASLDKPITLRVTDLKGIPGFTCYDEKKARYRIFADENLFEYCPARSKFTLAHELGHILLDHFTYTNNSLYMDYIMEREANTFVDELLMPTESILWHRCSVKEVAEIYEVSVLAAYNKISHIKSNALYGKIQAEIASEMMVYNQVRYLPYTDYRSKIVEKMRNDWLDPDYEFGGL